MGKLFSEAEKIQKIMSITDDLNHVKDIDSLLHLILTEARKSVNAEAGSIYLLHGDRLEFSYVQNQKVALTDSTSNKHRYSKLSIEINDKSIAGYVALTCKTLRIKDAYKLDKGLSYSFNKRFDQKNNFKTKSILTVPLMSSRDKIIGVMQIINARDENDSIVSFNEEDDKFITFMGNNAAVAIERAIMTREIILRMIKMAELRDPKETGHHVNRVAAYSIEIYDRWATRKKTPKDKINKIKDTLRIAAMLHDVGKVAIPDAILKKPGKLSDQEYEHMKEHTVRGADLFQAAFSDWDTLAAEIALDHHERWDGKGYPGDFTRENDKITFGKGKKGKEILIYGRIVALADVYDALVSKRIYKLPWPEEKVLKLIREESGKQFDPDIVNIFFEIYDIIVAIKNKYSE